jgi:hypothetical protein
LHEGVLAKLGSCVELELGLELCWCVLAAELELELCWCVFAVV